MKPRLTVGIPTCARPDKIAACLESVRRYVDVEHEIIVVDSAFDEANRSIYDAYPNLQLLAMDSPIGPSEARMEIAKRLSTPFLLYLDDDNEVTDGCVAALQTHLDEHDDVGIAAGGWWEYDRYRPIGQRLNFGRIDGKDAVYKSYVTVEQSRELGVSSLRVDLCLATMLVRREVFERVQFDPQYGFFYELFDFFMQCHREGVVVDVLPGVVFEHKPTAYVAPTQRQLSARDDDRQRFADKWNVEPLGGLGGVSDGGAGDGRRRGGWRSVWRSVPRFLRR